MNWNYYNNRGCLSTILGIMGGVTIICLIFVITSRLRNDTVTANLRGGRVMIFRLPTEEIIVYDDGRAARSTGDPTSTVATTVWVQLPSSIWQSADKQRTEWCDTSPNSLSKVGDPTYDIGLLCGPFKVKEIAYSKKLLPAPFENLITYMSSPGNDKLNP